jgi:hypothetical protein
MSCGGGHLGFPLGIKNRNCSDMKFKMAATAGLSLTLDPMGRMFQNTSSLKPSCRSRHFEFHIGTKNVEFVEDHPMNILVQFGFNHIPLQILCFLCRSEIQDGRHRNT